MRFSVSSIELKIFKES